MIRIGVVASSNGSVFKAVHGLLGNVAPGRFNFFVVTDRPCGIEEECDRLGVERVRIEEEDNRAFSRRALEAFRGKGGAEAIFLFFLRLVTEELYREVPVFNVHPSLLPAFPGFNPVERMAEARCRYLGVTLHLVDETVDGGPVVLQGVYPVRPGLALEFYHRISWLQKTYAVLAFLEQLAAGNVAADPAEGTVSLHEEPAATPLFNPALADPAWEEAFRAFEKADEGRLSLCARL